MDKLETICLRGHVEHVDARYEEAGRRCYRRFKDGTFCDSPIVNSFRLLDESEREAPLDSVAPGVLLNEDKICVECGDLRARCTGDEDEYEEPEEDLEPASEPDPAREYQHMDDRGRWIAPWLPSLYRQADRLLPYRPALVGAAVASVVLTWYLYATGHWILALLV